MTSTVSGYDTSLKSLRDRPFELLKEMERRSRPVTAAAAPDAAEGREWVGVACRMGGETFLIAREETREVLGFPTVITRIPGAKSWVKHVIFQGEPAKNAPAKGGDRLALRDFPPGTAGTGLQMTAIDIDRDGDLDLVCPGKSGLYLFENLRDSR